MPNILRNSPTLSQFKKPHMPKILLQIIITMSMTCVDDDELRCRFRWWLHFDILIVKVQSRVQDATLVGWWLMEKSRRQLWQREPPRWSVIMTKKTAADNYAPIVIIFSLSSPPSYPLKSRLMVMLMTPRMMICLIYMGDKICCCIFPGTFCKQILKKIIWNWSK